MRKCNKCGCEKIESEFPDDRPRKDCNGILRQFRCKKCKQKMQTDHRKEVAMMVKEVKRAAKCKICNCQDFRCLVFHHRNPEEKEFLVSQATMQGLCVKRIMEEIEKCDVLCANCHTILHYNERNINE